MVFSFQSISLQAWFKKVPCQNLRLVDEIWDSSPSKVKIMRGKPTEFNLDAAMLPPPSHSLTLFFFLFLSTRGACSTGKKCIGAKIKRLIYTKELKQRPENPLSIFSPLIGIFKFNLIHQIWILSSVRHWGAGYLRNECIYLIVFALKNLTVQYNKEIAKIHCKGLL